MSMSWKRSVQVALSIVMSAQILSAWSPNVAQADGGEYRTDSIYRKGRWEFMLSPQYSLSRNIGFQGGTNVKVEDTFGFAFQFGYNFNEHVNLGGLFSWARPDYQGTVQPAPGNPVPTPRSINGTIETSTIGLVMTYNILKGPLTPYLDAMVGGTYVNTDIVSGQPVNGCFWDPWYGYICGSAYPTKYDTFLSYAFGGGVRWDVNHTLFLRGGFRQQFVDFSGTGTPSVSIFKLDIGILF